MDVTRQRATAFKIGFLTKVAEMGRTPDEFVAMTKQADAGAGLGLLALLGGATDTGKAALSGGAGAALTGAKMLGGAAIAAPVGLGMLSGGLEAKLKTPTSEDIDSFRTAELTALYERLTREIQDRVARRAKGAA